MTEGRLSIIVHSPIFQLELQKRRIRKEALALEIQEEVLRAGKLGVEFHKHILEETPGQPTEIKQRSATVMATLATKLVGQPQPHSGGNGDGGNGGGSRSYEEVLRELTVREKRTIVNQEAEAPKLVEENYPPDEEELSPFDDQQTEGEDDSTPFPKIEELVGGGNREG